MTFIRHHLQQYCGESSAQKRNKRKREFEDSNIVTRNVIFQENADDR